MKKSRTILQWVTNAALLVAVLVMLLFSLAGCRVPEKLSMPTKSAGQQLFYEHYPEINKVMELLWEHYAEFDALVSEGEDTLHLFSRGWTKEDWRYAQTSLSEAEKDRIFSVWSLLDTNGLSVTYYQSHPTLAPVIALHCGFDEDGRSFGYYYIRPITDGDAVLTPRETIDKRISNEGFSNPNSYAEWSETEFAYWYQGVTQAVLYDVGERQQESFDHSAPQRGK